jgi:hypothetical protein
MSSPWPQGVEALETLETEDFDLAFDLQSKEFKRRPAADLIDLIDLMGIF